MCYLKPPQPFTVVQYVIPPYRRSNNATFNTRISETLASKIIVGELPLVFQWYEQENCSMSMFPAVKHPQLYTELISVQYKTPIANCLHSVSHTAKTRGQLKSHSEIPRIIMGEIVAALLCHKAQVRGNTTHLPNFFLPLFSGICSE